MSERSEANKREVFKILQYYSFYIHIYTCLSAFVPLMEADQVGYFMSKTCFCPVFASTNEPVCEENAGAIVLCHEWDMCKP